MANSRDPRGQGMGYQDIRQLKADSMDRERNMPLCDVGAPKKPAARWIRKRIKSLILGLENAGIICPFKAQKLIQVFNLYNL